MRRRSFPGGLLAAAAGGTLLALRPWRSRRRGPADDGVLSILVASVEPVVGLPVEIEHYRAFFRVRMESRPGSRAIYEAYAAHATAAAGGRPFTELDVDERRAIVYGAAERKTLVLEILD